MTFEVRLQQFSGPLQLLLDFIEKEEVPITDVSLATITEDYLNHVNSNEVPTEELADFLIVATKLLYIKSKAILPLPDLDEEEEESTLALQLKMYKEFVDASKHIEKLFESSNTMFAREKTLVVKPREFVAPKGVTGSVLSKAFKSLLKRLEPFFALQAASIKRVVSVQEKIRQMQDAILERSRMTFKEVVKGAGSKVDIVVSFLALLELVKLKVVSTVQQDTFKDIEIVHVK